MTTFYFIAGAAFSVWMALQFSRFARGICEYRQWLVRRRHAELLRRHWMMASLWRSRAEHGQGVRLSAVTAHMWVSDLLGSAEPTSDQLDKAEAVMDSLDSVEWMFLN